MGQNVVVTELANHFSGLVAGETGGSLVPIQNASLAIDEIDAVADVVENFLVKAGITGQRAHLLTARPGLVRVFGFHSLCIGGLGPTMTRRSSLAALTICP